jgi:diguanylate cyclase (GGDEF)-like protein
MLTVHARLEELSKAFDAGVDDFLAKPFTEADLLARLRSGLRAVALYDELSRQHQGSRKLNEQLTNLNNRLERLAITDDLTGLYNRRQAMHRLEEHWAMGDRYQRPVAVITLDIDHFKRFNDEHGHPAGDVRTTDAVCRIGGEEFLIVLPNQTMQEAEFCAERCRTAVESWLFELDDKRLNVTISAGVASRRGEMHQCIELLGEADAALYAAKHAGRNTVRVARSDPAAHAA